MKHGRNLLALVFCASVALAAVSAGADAKIALLPDAVGERVHYRIAGTTLGANGLQATTTAIDLVRESDTTFLIERNAEQPDAPVLQLGGDSRLAIARAPRAPAAALQLVDLVHAFNLALAATQDIDQVSHGGWQANIAVASFPGVTVPIALFPSNVEASDFDFSGKGDVTSPTPPPTSAPRGRPGQPAGDTDFVVTTVRIEGQVRAGRVLRVAIAQTRSNPVASGPPITVGSWSVTVVK